MKFFMYVLGYLFLAAVVVSCTTSNSANAASENNRDYASSAQQISPVLTGTQIPDVEVNTAEGDTIRLMDLVAEKPAILIFYRGGWCPYCNAHLAELQEVEGQLTDMGYQILAIGADRPELLRNSIDQNNLSYTLLSDASMKASMAFGIAYKVEKSVVERYKKNGTDFEKRSGYGHHLLPVPAVFLVDQNSMIHFQYVNPDYSTRIKASVLLAAAEAYYPDAQREDNSN